MVESNSSGFGRCASVVSFGEVAVFDSCLSEVLCLAPMFCVFRVYLMAGTFGDMRGMGGYFFV